MLDQEGLDEAALASEFAHGQQALVNEAGQAPPGSRPARAGTGPSAHDCCGARP